MKIKKLLEKMNCFFKNNDKPKEKKLKKLEEIIEKLKTKRKKIKAKLGKKSLDDKEKEILYEELKVINKLLKKAKKQF
jgi:Na+/phosphate symporter